MNVLRVDHTAIAVHNLDDAVQRYSRVYGIPPAERLAVPDQRVEVAFFELGDTEVELIQPADEESGVARYLRQRGEGLHHIGLQVDNIERELRALEAEGIELIDRHPRQGLHGLIAFVHPRSTGGVLLELVQRSQVVPTRIATAGHTGAEEKGD